MMSLSLPCHRTAQQYDDLTPRHTIENSASDANSDVVEGHAEHRQQHLATSAAQAAHSFLHSRQFTCLYSKHKTQKRKTWLDGRLVVFGSGKVVLHAACPPPGSGDPVLDQTELTRLEARAILENHLQTMEMEKYLITVDGPWIPQSIATSTNAVVAVAVSHAMRKVLSTKYQKPAAIAPPPPPPPPPHLRTENWAKRRKPLQPGELVRRYYPSLVTDTTTTEPRHLDTPLLSSSSSSSSSVTTSQHCHSQWPQQRRHQSIDQHDRSNVATTMEPPPPLHSYHHPPSSSTPELDCSNSHDYVAPTSAPRISSPAQSMPAPDLLALTDVATIQPRRDANHFVTNGFNANSFYGEDFDDDDETDQQPAPFHLLPTVTRTSSVVAAVAVPPAGHERGATNATSVEARSAADLLALFDVASTQVDESGHNEMGGTDEYILPSQDSSDASTS
jgi:Protein of unknown function (DUF2439)